MTDEICVEIWLKRFRLSLNAIACPSLRVLIGAGSEHGGQRLLGLCRVSGGDAVQERARVDDGKGHGAPSWWVSVQHRLWLEGAGDSRA